jgi:hypothetical protein
MLRGYRRQGSGPDASPAVAVTVGVPPGSPLSGTVPFPVGLSLLHLLGLDLLTGVVTLVSLAWLDERPGVTIPAILRDRAWSSSTTSPVP